MGHHSLARTVHLMFFSSVLGSRCRRHAGYCRHYIVHLEVTPKQSLRCVVRLMRNVWVGKALFILCNTLELPRERFTTYADQTLGKVGLQ